MAKKDNKIPRLVVPKNASLRKIYARVRAEFTAADLQKYTEIEEGIPAKVVIAELEAIDRQESNKRKKAGRAQPRKKRSSL
ncbi:MAG: hypothetical protein ACJ8FY_01200 [Gemmataceae bacterium]